MGDIELNLNKLGDCEKLMDEAERDAEFYRIIKTQPIFQKRRDILKNIPKFWYLIIAENDDFSDYVSVEDLKYLESISDIYVHYKIADDNELRAKDFSITIEFDNEEGGRLVPPQTITKHFTVTIEDGEEKITSEPASIVWPTELDLINPQLIKSESKKTGKPIDKKLYRMGMKSFFAWFDWTGEKPGKEFRNGEDLTRLIIDDLFPYAVKYYTEALPGGDEGDDTSDPEELDLSEDEHDSQQDSEDDHDKKKRKLN